jgi:hypothetical protein
MPALSWTSTARHTQAGLLRFGSLALFGSKHDWLKEELLESINSKAHTSSSSKHRCLDQHTKTWTKTGWTLLSVPAISEQHIGRSHNRSNFLAEITESSRI